MHFYIEQCCFLTNKMLIFNSKLSKKSVLLTPSVSKVVLGYLVVIWWNPPTPFIPQSNSKQIRVGFYPPKNCPLQYNSKRNQPYPFPRTTVFGQHLSINTAKQCSLPVVLLKKYGAFSPVLMGVPAVLSTKSIFWFHLLIVLFNNW